MKVSEYESAVAEGSRLQDAENTVVEENLGFLKTYENPEIFLICLGTLDK